MLWDRFYLSLRFFLWLDWESSLSSLILFSVLLIGKSSVLPVCWLYCRHHASEYSLQHHSLTDDWLNLNQVPSSLHSSSMNEMVPSHATIPICSPCSDGWARTRKPALARVRNWRIRWVGDALWRTVTLWDGGRTPCGGSFTSTWKKTIRNLVDAENGIEICSDITL